MTDAQLLQTFAASRDEAAFRQLVERHAGLVYSAAVRHLGGRKSDADDIVQEVFSKVAQKAHALAQHASLAGWLYTTSRLLALENCRRERRRIHRESEATEMNETNSTPDWEQVRPVLDSSLNELDSSDRESILLRFFGKRSFREIGEQLGLSEGTAQKRVERALDRLHAVLVRRGIGCSASALATGLACAHSAPPAGLIGSVSTTALSGITTVALNVTAKIWFAAASIAAAGVVCAGVALIGTANSRADHHLPATQVPRSEKAGVAQNATPVRVETSNVSQAIPAVKFDRRNDRAATVEPKAASPATVQLADYVVQRGDTGAMIAQKTGTTVEELLILNQGVRWDRLRAGQIIHVVMPK